MIKIETAQREDGSVDVKTHFEGNLMDYYVDTIMVAVTLGEKLDECLPDYGKSALRAALAELEKKGAEA